MLKALTIFVRFCSKKAQCITCKSHWIKLLYTHTHCILKQLTWFYKNKVCPMSNSPVCRLNALRTSLLGSGAQNVVQLPLPIEGFPGEGRESNREGNRVNNDKGWNYLLSSSVSFSKDVMNAIRIQKPEKEKVPEWISKLITGGQCKTLYVENIDLDLQPTDSDMIRKLCELYSVSLVNVRVDSNTQNRNVAVGPW